jgi:hypothetical protein
MSLKLNSSGGGSVTLQEPTTASNVTLNLPAADGTVNTSGAVNEVPAGSASAPSIYPTGDTNTGIFFPAADTIAFTEGGVESARIDASGNLLVGKTVTTETVTGVSIGGSLGQIACSSNSGADAAIFYRPTSNGSFGVLLTKSDVGGTNTLVGVGYANGTFGAVSDINKKKNVEDSRGYLNDLMQIRVVKYNWITDEEGAPKELGWIAQEVEQLFPGMVNEIGGSKLLKKEVFLPMLLKAIQEQQAMIDTMKQEITELKGLA